jgi:hypothetical protein
VASLDEREFPLLISAARISVGTDDGAGPVGGAVEVRQRCGITWPERASAQATCDSYRSLVRPVLL